MAKVTQPLGSAEARGRVGGYVYNTWRGLHTVKTHKAPAHESDPLRQAHKAIVQAAGIRWQSISPERRSSWNQFANEHPDIDWTGNPKRLPGYAWYVRIQTRLIDIGATYIDDPPSAFSLPLISGLAASYEPGDGLIYLSFSMSLPVGTFFSDTWSTRPLSAGRTPSLHDAYRRVILPDYVDPVTWEPPGAGTYTVWLRMIRDNGLLTPWLRSAPCTVT